MTTFQRHALDYFVGAAFGCLVTLAVTAATLYVEVKTFNVRLTALENTVSHITHVEVNHTTEGARIK